jgi:multiple sugar transport system ATP-binding protein
VLSRGVIQQVATPGELYARPANTFVATFIGSPAMNFLRARLAGGAVEFGSYRVDLPAGTLARLARTEGDVLLGLRPEHFADPRPAGSERAPDRLPVTVELAEQLGSETLVYFRADDVEAERVSEVEVELGGTLVARLDPRALVSTGDRLELGVDLERAHFFDPVTAAAL